MHLSLLVFCELIFVNYTVCIDPDPLGGVACPSLAESGSKPTKTKVTIFLRDLTDIKFRFHRYVYAANFWPDASQSSGFGLASPPRAFPGPPGRARVHKPQNPYCVQGPTERPSHFRSPPSPADRLRVWGTEIVFQDVVVRNGFAAWVVASSATRSG